MTKKQTKPYVKITVSKRGNGLGYIEVKANRYSRLEALSILDLGMQRLRDDMKYGGLHERDDAIIEEIRPDDPEEKPKDKADTALIDASSPKSLNNATKEELIAYIQFFSTKNKRKDS